MYDDTHAMQFQVYLPIISFQIIKFHISLYEKTHTHTLTRSGSSGDGGDDTLFLSYDLCTYPRAHILT